MDATRFDRIAKILATDASRRRLLHGMAGSLAALLAATREGAPAGAVRGKRRHDKADRRRHASRRERRPACRRIGEPCQSADNPGQGNKCCASLVCETTGRAGGACRCPAGRAYCVASGTCYDPNAGECCSDAECDDSDACTTAATCDLSANACRAGSPVVCPPSPDPCKVAVCVDPTGCVERDRECPPEMVCCSVSGSPFFGQCATCQLCEEGNGCSGQGGGGGDDV